MSKLRVIKDRTVDQEVSNDLRGLGRDPLLRQSFPFCGLILKNVTTAEIEPLCNAFSLQIRETDKKSHHLITAKHLNDGEHKQQSLALFYCALAIHQNNANAKMTIELFQPMHFMMGERITKNNHVSMDQTYVESWKKAEFMTEHFLLHSSIATFLHDAGFKVSKSEKNINLTDQQIRGIIDEIRHQQTAKQKEAK